MERIVFSFSLQLSGIAACILISERSLSAYFLEKLLRDLLFVSRDLREEVTVLLSVTISDGAKFVDAFSEFCRGQKSTEVIVKENSLVTLLETLGAFFRTGLDRLEIPIINYKIKFCYLNK